MRRPAGTGARRTRAPCARPRAPATGSRACDGCRRPRRRARRPPRGRRSGGRSGARSGRTSRR
ncbi:cupin, partial [Schumannella luteola]